MKRIQQVPCGKDLSLPGQDGFYCNGEHICHDCVYELFVRDELKNQAKEIIKKINQHIKINNYNDAMVEHIGHICLIIESNYLDGDKNDRKS